MQLVEKQAFFWKCSRHPKFPIESRHFPHFSFPHNSLVVSLSFSLIGLSTLKDLISTASWNGLNPPRSLSANLIFVSSEKKVSLFSLLSVSSIRVKGMSERTKNRWLTAINNALHQVTLKVHKVTGIVTWASLLSQIKWFRRKAMKQGGLGH